MTRTLFLYLLLLITRPGAAQEKVFQYDAFKRTGSHVSGDVAFRPFGNYSSRVIVDEASQGYLMTVSCKDEFKRIYFPFRGKPQFVLQQYKDEIDKEPEFSRHALLPPPVLNLFKKHNVVGGLLYRTQVVEVVRHRLSMDFIFVETDLNTGKTSFSDTISSSGREKLLFCGERNKALYLLTFLDAKLPRYRIYWKKPGSAVTYNDVKISEQQLQAVGLKEDDIDPLSNRSLSLFENGRRLHPVMTLAHTKGFKQDDRIVFALSNKNLKVALLTIFLDQDSTAIQQINLYHQSNIAPKRATSYIIDSLCYTAQFEGKKIILKTHHIATAATLDSAVISEDNFDSWTNTGITKTGNFTASGEMKEASFRRMQEAVLNHGLALSGYKEKGLTYLGFAAPVNLGLTGTDLINFMNFSAGVYGSLMSNTPDNYVSMIYGAPVTPNIGFGTAVTDDLKPAKGAANFSIWEKMNGFRTVRGIELGACLTFYNAGYYYIGYFSDLGRYAIHRFDERGVE
jgi:hypothetical protein